MKLSIWGKERQRLVLAFRLCILAIQDLPSMSYAQNLGAAPATGQAVQGQTAAQPEGTVLNLVNRVGNVIAPVGAALAVAMAIIATIRLGVQRIEDPHHPRGCRELRSGAEMRKLLNRKIVEQDRRCAICHEEFTDYSDIVPDHKDPKGMAEGMER
jgi:hypothetical protein